MSAGSYEEESNEIMPIKCAETLHLDESSKSPRMTVGGTPSNSVPSTASYSSASKRSSRKARTTPTPSKRILQSTMPLSQATKTEGGGQLATPMDSKSNDSTSKTTRKSPTDTNNTSSSINRPKIMKNIKKGLVDLKSPKTQTFEKYLSVAATSMFDDDDDGPLEATTNAGAVTPSLSTPIVLSSYSQQLQQRQQDINEREGCSDSNDIDEMSNVTKKAAAAASSLTKQGDFLLFKPVQKTVYRQRHEEIENSVEINAVEKENIAGNKNGLVSFEPDVESGNIMDTSQRSRPGSVDIHDKTIGRSLELEFIQPLPPMPPHSPVLTVPTNPHAPMLIKRDIISTSTAATKDEPSRDVKNTETASTTRPTGNMNLMTNYPQISTKDFLVMMLSENDLSPYASLLLDGEGRSCEVEDEANASTIENFMQMDSAKLDAQFDVIMNRHNSLATFTSDGE